MEKTGFAEKIQLVPKSNVKMFSLIFMFIIFSNLKVISVLYPQLSRY